MLRFAAAALVLGVHTGYVQRPSRWTVVLGHGAVGVSFFFLLSGFVLAWTARATDSPLAFYRRRAARVYPTYLLTLLIAALLVFPEGGRLTPVPLASGALLVQAWLPRKYLYFGVSLVAWSLSCEAFFYLCFPALQRLLGPASPRRRARVAAVLLGAEIALPLVARVLFPRSLAGSEDFPRWLVYICPLTRMAEFVLGMLLAMAMRDGFRLRLDIWWAALLAAAAIGASVATPGLVSVVAVTVVPFLVLIAAAATRDLDGPTGPYRRGILVVLGEWSFALYMLHTLWLRVARLALRHSPDTVLRDVLVLVVVVTVSIVTSGIWHRFIETPLDRRLRPAPIHPASRHPRP